MEGEHFIIKHSGEVPGFIEEAKRKLSNAGELGAVVKDITGCFPNMEKGKIRFALMDTLEQLRRERNLEAVAVPDKNSEKCIWITKATKRVAKNKTVIPSNDLLEIMDFALENAFTKTLDGTLMRQTRGIPMGDPNSPGMTIITCAWMEKQWMMTLDSDTKNRFIARRYMDDILMFYSRSGEWDHERFLKDFERSDCYMPPLCLEEGQAGTFLETNFQITSANGVRTWLKSNPSKGGNWKYAHYGSHSSKAQKRAVLVACL